MRKLIEILIVFLYLSISWILYSNVLIPYYPDLLIYMKNFFYFIFFILILINIIDIKNQIKNVNFILNSEFNWLQYKYDNGLIILPSDVIIQIIKNFKNKSKKFNFLSILFLPISLFNCFMKKILFFFNNIIFLKSILSTIILSVIKRDFVIVEKKEKKSWKKCFVNFYIFCCKKPSKKSLILAFLSNISVRWVSGFSLNVLIENEKFTELVINLYYECEKKTFLGILRTCKSKIMKNKFYIKLENEELDDFLSKHNIYFYFFKKKINDERLEKIINFISELCFKNKYFFKPLIASKIVTANVGRNFLIKHPAIINYIYAKIENEKFNEDGNKMYSANIFTTKAEFPVGEKTVPTIKYGVVHKVINNGSKIEQVNYIQYFSHSIILDKLISDYSKTEHILLINKINNQRKIDMADAYMKYKIALNNAEFLIKNKKDESELEIPIQYGISKYSKSVKISELVNQNSDLDKDCKDVVINNLKLTTVIKESLSKHAKEDREFLEESFDFLIKKDPNLGSHIMAGRLDHAIDCVLENFKF